MNPRRHSLGGQASPPPAARSLLHRRPRLPIDREGRGRLRGWGAAALLALLAGYAGPGTALAQADRPTPPRVNALRPLPGGVGQQRPLPDSAVILDADERLYDGARLRELRLSYETADWQSALQRNRALGKDTPARLTMDGEVLETIGVRYKGNTSLSVNGPKKPLNLSLDAFTAGQRLWGYDVINLNNGWADPSQIREAVAFTLLRNYMPVPQVSFARVYANDAYVGVYLMMEQIDKTFVEAWFAGRDGLIFKGDNPKDITLESSTLNYQSALRSYKTGYELKTTAAGDQGYQLLQELTRALDATTAQGGLSDQDFPARIHEQLDVDLALWYLAGNNLLGNYDSYYAGHNYYLYRDARDPRFSILNWDWNLSFGTFQNWFGRVTRSVAETDPFDQSTQRNRPLTRRLLKVPEFRADYIAHLRTLRDEALDGAVIGEVAQAYHDLIAEAVHAEPRPLYAPELFDQNLGGDVMINMGGVGAGQQMKVLGLLPLAEARRAYLADGAKQPALVAPDLRLAAQSLDPASPATGQAVRVTASFTGTDAPARLELRYRVERGPETRLAMKDDGSGRWTAEIPSQPAGRDVSYFLRAAVADGRSAFFPAANLTRPFHYRVQGVSLPRRPAGDLVINELLADNQAARPDPYGEREDWVEVYNRGAAPVDLAGWYLSDNPDSPWDFPLPPLRLPAKGHLLIWADGQPEQGADHAPFRLSRGGETVVLARRDAVYDEVIFGPQAADESHGRRLDGLDDWTVCWPASPGRANDCRARGWRAFAPWAGGGLR